MDMLASEKQMEHAWKYFEIHANQRMQMFNYFVVISSGVTAGLASTLQSNSANYSILGILLGLLLILINFIFWKLDQRTSYFIKHAENSLMDIEALFPSNNHRLFISEKNQLDNGDTNNWTYSKSFKFMFTTMSFIGFCGVVISSARLLKLTC